MRANIKHKSCHNSGPRESPRIRFLPKSSDHVPRAPARTKGTQINQILQFSKVLGDPLHPPRRTHIQKYAYIWGTSILVVTYQLAFCKHIVLGNGLGPEI